MANVINIREFVDVTTGVASTPTDVSRDWGAVLFVQKGTDSQTTTLTKYDDLAALIEGAGSNSEAAKFATILYSPSFNNITLSSPVYVAVIGMADEEEFSTNLTALLANEQYYYIGLDKNCSAGMKKAAAALVQANQSVATHKLVTEDFSATAFNTSLEDDVALGTSMSLTAYCKSNAYTHSMIVNVNPSNPVDYYSASAIAFYATRKFDATVNCMAPIAHKPVSGISAVNLEDSAITVSASQAYANIKEKSGNVYANVKTVGITAWEPGETPSGDELSEYISADYLNYVISVSIFQMLQRVPRLPMNIDGASMISSVLDAAFGELYAAGIIGPGVSMDGEVFGGRGFKYSVPLPSGVKKANGLWDGIYCEALLAGSAKKVVIGNSLKK